MIALAIWLAEFGYTLLYIAYSNLSSSAKPISLQDALNPRLNAGPYKNGSATKSTAGVKSETPAPSVNAPVGTTLV